MSPYFFCLSPKKTYMNNQQIINYIKLREVWKDILRAKSNALSFYLSLAFGLWGLVYSAIGAWKYLQNSQKADLLKYQTEELEKKLLEDKLWGN